MSASGSGRDESVLALHRPPYVRRIPKADTGSETWIAWYTDENNDYHMQSIGTVTALKLSDA
jgi:hypothetical protein